MCVFADHYDLCLLNIHVNLVVGKVYFMVCHVVGYIDASPPDPAEIQTVVYR